MLAFTKPCPLLRLNGAFPPSQALARSLTPIRHLNLTFSSSTTSIPTLSANAKPSTPPRKMPAVLRPVVPGPELLKFNVEDRAQPRSEILRALNSYVKEKKLQNPEDRRIFLCDDKLRDLLGVEECTYFGINRYISQYIRKPEEIGGRYIEEAAQVEQLYLEKKLIEDQNNPKSPKSKKVSSKPRVFKPLRLSEDLAVVCRAPEMTRPNVLKSVWAYIRLNNLQSGPGKNVKCDFLLKKVFGKDEIGAREIMKGITPHMTKI